MDGLERSIPGQNLAAPVDVLEKAGISPLVDFLGKFLVFCGPFFEPLVGSLSSFGC